MSTKKINEPFVVRALSYVVNKIWLLFAFCIISLATLFLLLELLLPEVNRYKPEIVSWIEKNYQIDIEVDSISAKWSSSGPSISLINFSVLSDDKTFNIFEVNSLSIEFDLLSSILNREYSTNAILLHGANIRFYIDRKLGVKLSTFTNLKAISESNALDKSQIEDVSKRFFDLLVAQKKIEIVSSKLQLMTLTGSNFNYDVENLTVKRYVDNHQMVGHLKNITESTKHSNSIKLIAEVFHGIDEKDNYTNLYLELDETDLASLPKIGHFFEKNILSDDETKNYQMLNAESEQTIINENVKKKTVATLKIWARWRNRHWQTMDAQFHLNGSKDLSAILSWRNEDYHHGYAVLHDLVIGNQNDNALNGKKMTEVKSKNTYHSNEVAFKYSQEEKENISWDIIINDFDLSSLLNYLPSVLSKNVKGIEWLKDSKMSLQLEHFRMNFTKNKLKWTTSPLNLRFSDLRMKNKKNMPVFSDLNGWILFDFETQFFQSRLESNSSELIVDELFRELIPVDKFSTNIMTDLSEGFNELIISELVFLNSDFEINANAKFYLDNGQPNLSIEANIFDGDVSQTFRYLPTGIMSDSLVEYLDSSIKTGELMHATAVMRGPISLFPYPNNLGVFAVLAKVNNATYKFLPDWPLVKNVKAELLFEGPGMFINVETAESLGNQLTSAEISIVNMTSDDSSIKLQLDIESLDNHGRNFLEHSPLVSISDGLKSLSFRGGMRSYIDLLVPLSGEGDSKNVNDNKSELTLSGNVQPIGDTLNLDLSFIQVESVKGELVFNDKGIVSSTIFGNVDGKLIQADIQTIDVQNNKEHVFLEIDLKGIFPSSSIDKFIDGNWSDFLSGEAAFDGKVIFIDHNKDFNATSNYKSAAQSKIKVNFSSDIKGISIKLPDFLDKKMDVITPFQLDLTFLKNDVNKSQQGEVNWHGINAEWLINSDQEYSVFVDLQSENINSNKPKEINASNNGSNKLVEEIKETPSIVENSWSYPNGITLQGNIEEINLKKWITTIDQIENNYSSEINAKKNENKNVEWLVNKLDLSVNRVLIPGLKKISTVELTADKYLDLPWRLSLKSQHGNVDILIDEETPWLVNAENIDLHFDDTSNHAESQSELEIEKLASEQSARHFNIYSSLPEMDISCNLCQFNEKNVGNFRASIRRGEEDDKSISLKAKVEKGAEHQLSLSAVWSMDVAEMNDEIVAKTSHEKTNIDFLLATNNVGTLLNSWGFKPSIEDSKGKVIGNLNWNNSPWRVDYKKLSGFGRLDFGKGYLSQISDADGRIFALFNLKSILRKLTFDFEDVYKKGFFYDSMGGSVKINNGIISTYDTSIKGNVADVWLYGTTDLNNETVEQHAIVSPHITSSFPVLAAWALEPTTGIILYLLNKIMEPAIDVATQIDYRVHGSFDNPIVDEIKKSKKRVKINLDGEIPGENNNKKKIKVKNKTTDDGENDD